MIRDLQSVRAHFELELAPDMWELLALQPTDTVYRPPVFSSEQRLIKLDISSRKSEHEPNVLPHRPVPAPDVLYLRRWLSREYSGNDHLTLVEDLDTFPRNFLG